MDKNTLNIMTSNKSDEWETPQNLYDDLNEEFHFTLDPASQSYNHKCEKYYTKEDDGLNKCWKDEIVFCNPPYGRSIGKWVKKCYEEHIKNNITVVMLIPSRTDTKWFHKYIYHKADEIRFLQGRLKFINRTFPSYRDDGNFKISPAPFPSMIAIYKKQKK